ncbi:hypothetical protein ACN6K9_005839 [Streptomyces sp. SAS_267]|uniref:hypothetical protein n=1 Tax=Streptomyces sp. SAS_267 TaxID=3412750 RepID=UPI00403C21D5
MPVATATLRGSAADFRAVAPGSRGSACAPGSRVLGPGSARWAPVVTGALPCSVTASALAAPASAPASAVGLPGEGAQTFAALSGVVPVLPAAAPARSAPVPSVLRVAGADIALLSGVTRIHPVSAGAVPAAVESERRSGEVPGPVAPDAARWAGGRVSAGRWPGRVLVACGVSRFVMVVPPR